MENIIHLTAAELESGLDTIKGSPKESGVLELIVCRPEEDARDVLEEGNLDLEVGLVSDNWSTDSGDRDVQLTLMNSRAAQLVAQDKLRWQLAGDQLYVDFDLSDENLTPGNQLEIGSAVVEVTEKPHNGCRKFVQRFGRDAMIFVNSPIGKKFHLRGINAKVVKPGKIRTGDFVTKI